MRKREIMTTIGIETMSLTAACESAGIGGVVSRNSVSYEVGLASIGVIGLRLNGERGMFAEIGDNWAQDDWTVVSRAEEAAAQTVREFFAAVPAGTHVVRPRSADTYVWSGIFTAAENNPVVFSRDYGTWTAVELGDNANDWVVCTDGDDEPIVEGILSQRTMRDVIRGNARHAANNVEIARLRQDWRQLNEFLNEYADKNSMCSDYERQLNDWNEGFELLELEGRKRIYRVRVRVQTTHYVDVDVEATTEDAAIEEINDMYASDIMNDNGDWSDYSDIDHDVQNVSRM
jgi:hypothetical protein